MLRATYSRRLYSYSPHLNRVLSFLAEGLLCYIEPGSIGSKFTTESSFTVVFRSSIIKKNIAQVPS